MNKNFFNLDNSSYSKVMLLLLYNQLIRMNMRQISELSYVPYEKTKIIIARMYKFGMLKRYVKSGYQSFAINMNNSIVKCFDQYQKCVIGVQKEKK